MNFLFKIVDFFYQKKKYSFLKIMSSQLKPSDRFKKNMIILLEIISDMFEEASDNKIVGTDTKLLTILKVIINSTNGDYMINNFFLKFLFYHL